MSQAGRIAVIGSANVDFIMKVAKLPAIGETVTEGEYMQTFGGKGANTAVAATRAGGNVGFLACLGDEHFGREMVDNFRGDGMDTSPIRLLAGESSGTALVMFDAAGDNYLTVAPGTNFSLTPAVVAENETLIADAEIVLLQMEIPVESNREVLRLAEKHGTRVMLNYAPVRAESLALSAAVTGLLVNEIEASALSGRHVHDADEAVDAARELLAKGPEFVVVTLGRAGAAVISGAGSQVVPGCPVKPVDTTAAGDTFSGALGVALAEGRELPEAVGFANAAAALSVTRMGAQPSIPRREEIDAFLSRQSKG